MRAIIILRTLVVALTLTLVTLSAFFAAEPLPAIQRPYLGAYCIDPATDGDLTFCYGMDPFGEAAEAANWPAEPPAEWTR